MLYRPTSAPLPAPVIGPRHRCRNLRCGAKLKHPSDNPRDAFCCSTCFESFYRSRCLVCERPIARKTERRQVCDRQKCRGQFRRHREQFLGTRYPASVLSHNGLGSADKSGLKIGTFGDRPFRIVAGPTLSPTALRLASLPLDHELAARLERAHRSHVEARAKAKRSAARAALIKRRTPPVNVLGGYQFPGAPAVDLSRTEPPPEWAVASRWKPTGDGTDVPPIPEFLLRATRRSRPAAAKRSSPCLVTTSIHGRMKKVRLSMYSTGQKAEANVRATRELAPRELAHCCLQETKGDVEKAAALLGRRARGARLRAAMVVLWDTFRARAK